MVFPVSNRQDHMTALQFGLSRFRQSTALIGATLLFCLSGVQADARILFYSYGDNVVPVDSDTPPNPISGGVWTGDGSVNNWRRLRDSGYDTNLTDFDSNDDAFFGSSQVGTTINVEIDGGFFDEISADSIVVTEGTFAFNDPVAAGNSGTQTLSGDLLRVEDGGALILNVHTVIDGAVTIEGAAVVNGVDVAAGSLTIATGRQLQVEDSVNVGGGLTMAAGSTVTGDVIVAADGTVDLNAASRITGTLTLAGEGDVIVSRVGGLVVQSGADVTVGGGTAQLDGRLTNLGDLSLGIGNYGGGLANTGTVNLIADVTFGTQVAPRTITNGSADAGVSGTIQVVDSSNRILQATGTFENYDILDGGTAGGTLTIQAATINIHDRSVLNNTVVLSGAINNSLAGRAANGNLGLDLAHVPQLNGAFVNNATAKATVTQDVIGNSQDFTNGGTLWLAGAAGTEMTGLDEFINTGGVDIAAGNTLGATTINHNAGLFNSRGTLIGAVTSNATANIRGTINGSYEVAGGTTTISSNLAVNGLSGAPAGGVIEVTGGNLNVLGGVTVTTERLVNDSTLNLDAGSSIVGAVESSGTFTGAGGIAGNLTFTGTDSGFTGTSLTVSGSVINARTDDALVSEFSNITYAALENRGTLTVDQAVNGALVNDASATQLTVNRVVNGNLTSAAATQLNNNVNGRLTINGGVTTVGVHAGDPTMTVTVGGPDALDLMIGANGELRVSEANLVSNGVIRATGKVDQRGAYTITAPRLVISGNSDSILRGRLEGELTVDSAGSVTLDGATIIGAATNNGTILGGDDSSRAVRLQGGFTNNLSATFGTTAQVAAITGLLRNNAGGTANIVGNVIAGGGQAGNVDNLGNLTLTGNVAGQVGNSSSLTLTGNAGSLINNAQGVAIVTGNIGTAGILTDLDVTNAGNLTVTGNIANSLQNTSTATITGTIGGNATNTGTLNLSGTVGQIASNVGAGSILNITGDSQITRLDSQGRTNILAGNRLNMTSDQLVNRQGATINVSGTLGRSVPGLLDVQNRAGSTVNVGVTGTLAGSLANGGTATVNGNVDGNVLNIGTGTLTLGGAAQIDGQLENRNVLNVTSTNATVDGGLVNKARAVTTVTGRLNANVTNQVGGRLVIDGGTVAGDITNDEGGRILSGGTIIGNVLNSGTFTLDGASGRTTYVEGNFTNQEGALLTQNANSSLLEVTGTLLNYGTISTGAFGEIRINGTVDNAGVLEGHVIINGDINNTNRIVYTFDTELIDDLTNSPDGSVDVRATVTGQGDNEIINRGTFLVRNGGEMVEIGSFDNQSEFTINRGGRIQADTFTNSAGTLTNDGRIVANVINREGAILTSTNSIVGNLQNEGTADLSGLLAGRLTTVNTDTDRTSIVGDLRVTRGVSNAGDLVIAEGATLTSDRQIENRVSGVILADGTIVGDVRNAGDLRLRNGMEGNLSNSGSTRLQGVLTGDMQNAGLASLSGQITGTLTNLADADAGRESIQIIDSLRVGAVANRGGTLTVDTDRSLTVDGLLRNLGSGALVIRGDVTVGDSLVNLSSVRMRMAEGSTLTGDLRNETGATLRGTIDGKVTNRGDVDLAGRITGDLINEGGSFDSIGDLVVDGQIINRREPLTGGMTVPGQPQLAPGDPAAFVVTENTTVTAAGGLTNDAYSTVTVNGNLVGDVTNDGTFDLNNRLTGNLVNNSQASLQGLITGNLIYAEDSAISLDGALRVRGAFDAFNDFTIGRSVQLEVGRYINRAGNQLTVSGTLNGAVDNRGTLLGLNGGQIGSLHNIGDFMVGRAADTAGTSFTVDGAFANNSTVDMASDGAADDVLNVNGNVSGTGTYNLYLDLDANGGAGASDLVVVRGGAVTGEITLSFTHDVTEPAATDESRRILVFDVDGSQGSANNFTYDVENLPPASERIIYSVSRDSVSGDLYMMDSINPALGALAGNLALTQSLIGSVVNRPSSPFVPGLAGGAGDKPCGAGAWARAVAGRASATGQTSSDQFTVGSSIEASYRGLQFGGDLACFEGSVSGWNVAVGVMGGVNDGTTTQPIYVNDPTDPSQLTGVLGSVNHGDFRQLYGGVYATASRGRWFLDLQARRERTSFTINNEPIGDNNGGLQLSDSEFDSNATTISGAVSYAYTLPREGWMFVPTAGFAFSNLSVDTIYFDRDTATGQDAELQIEDSKNRVGFIGGTVSKTFVNQQKESIIHAFGTATVYKDFAPETSSVFIMRDATGAVDRTDGLASSNLGTYGELSFGANYSKLLKSGSARSPRQFNASIRVDGRTGDVLDSYGVTAQVRLQF
ncbi:hypothetical protein FNJ84_02805 [Paracoccus sp. M683]|uniref:hypothetical protein n=1 Tax=Paracoccus sp. M683 TaxID=2594268 RepID=UPI001197E269|nr:hypothetical protein [Paracoccus sp. M683]TRW99624.1 hypothetical protein FNJ84_02805 [Paracoccus sp. M683]